MFVLKNDVYDVIVQKDDGTVVEGTMKDDGLQSLWPVKRADGTYAVVSVLDNFIKKVKI